MNLDQIKSKFEFQKQQQQKQKPSNFYYTSGGIVFLLIFLVMYIFKNFLFTIVYNLVSLVQSTFFLFSIFSWLYLVHFHITNRQRPPPFRRKVKNRTSNSSPNSSSCSTSNEDDKFIYSVFLLCLLSEFLLQFFIFNFNNNFLMGGKSNPNTSTKLSKLAQQQSHSKLNFSHFFLLENLFYLSTFFLLCILLLTNINVHSKIAKNNNNDAVSNYNNANISRRNSGLVTYCKLMLICSLTRVYGCVSFGPILPETICAYCAYFCAFAGILFAHYINFILDRLRPVGAEIVRSAKKRSKTKTAMLASAAALVRDEQQCSSCDLDASADENDEDEDEEEEEEKNDDMEDSDILPRFQHRNSYLTPIGFKRRTSLPTIPIKFDKNSIPEYSIILKEIKAKIDDLIGDASMNSIEPSHSISRLLNGLRNIRKLIGQSNQRSMPNVTNDNNNHSSTSSQSCSTKSTVRAAEPKSSASISAQITNNTNNNNASIINTFSKVLKKKIDIFYSTKNFSGNNNYKEEDYDDNEQCHNENKEENETGEEEEEGGGGLENDGLLSTTARRKKCYEDEDEGINNQRNSYSADEDDEDRRQEMVNSSIEAIRKQHRNRKSLPTHFYKRLFNSPITNILNSNNHQTSSIKFDVSSRQRSLSLKYGSINSNINLENAKRLQQLINQNENSKYANKRQSLENHSQEQQATSAAIMSANITIVQNEPKSQNNLINEKSNSNMCNSRCLDDNKTFLNDDEESTMMNPNGSMHSKGGNSNSQNSKTSDYESGESPTNSDYNSDTDKLHQRQTYHESHYHEILSLKKLEEIKEELTNRSKNQLSINNENGLQSYSWQIEDLQKNSDLLNYLHDWSFPIFRFSNCAKQFVLSQVNFH